VNDGEERTESECEGDVWKSLRIAGAWLAVGALDPTVRSGTSLSGCFPPP